VELHEHCASAHGDNEVAGSGGIPVLRESEAIDCLKKLDVPAEGAKLSKACRHAVSQFDPIRHQDLRMRGDYFKLCKSEMAHYCPSILVNAFGSDRRSDGDNKAR